MTTLSEAIDRLEDKAAWDWQDVEQALGIMKHQQGMIERATDDFNVIKYHLSLQNPCIEDALHEASKAVKALSPDQPMEDL